MRAIIRELREVGETVGRARSPKPLPMEDVAALVQRLAVLLSAGVSPLTAWAERILTTSEAITFPATTG